MRNRGSSPLARGLLDQMKRREMEDRIIPARAGFTRPSPASSRRTRDHPRSRGVYSGLAAIGILAPGSSPLARGLPPVGEEARQQSRIIPARAGFTSRLARTSTGRRDHPRSRGVYWPMKSWQQWSRGSSPLARGLHLVTHRDELVLGIIPARAGFTLLVLSAHGRGWDHPRSRGVYLMKTFALRAWCGSSPLARGLQPPEAGPEPPSGIIPARAGFTRPG